MNIRYDFGKKVDLTSFRKQFVFMTSKKSEYTIDIHLENFRILLKHYQPIDKKIKNFDIEFNFFEIKDGQMYMNLTVEDDFRFKNSNTIKNFYEYVRNYNIYTDDNIENSADIFCGVVNLLNYINKVKILW